MDFIDSSDIERVVEVQASTEDSGQLADCLHGNQERRTSRKSGDILLGNRKGPKISLSLKVADQKVRAKGREREGN